jgi:hypothetical protein
MQTLRRAVGILTFPAIAWLGVACERTDSPTGVRPVALVIADPTLVVDDDKVECPTAPYTSIQAAVNAAPLTGAIITVCPGTYPELLTLISPLTINKTLTLRGAQWGVDARTRVGLESIIEDPQGTFVTANNVVIDGFTVQNSIAPAFTGYGIAMGAGTSGTQILNNIIQNNIAGIALSNAPGGSQAVILHNQIQNNNVPGPATGQGIYTDQFVSGGAVTNVLIEENAFVGHVVAGIDVSNTALPGVSNLDISTNSFNLNGRAFILYNTHMSSFHDNSVTNSTTAADNPMSATLRILDNNTDLSIMNNNLTTGTAHAIRLTFFGDVGGPSSGVVINENNIGVVGSANFVLDGLLVDPGSHVGTVNATCNWWGSSTGPINVNNPGGTGEEVVGDADFTPWLLAPAPGGGCAGGGPSGKVTGGGQINLTGGGVGSFGFNAKSDGGAGSGHLNYLNHVTRAHLDCTVTAVLITPPNKARLSGPCSSTNAGGAMSFTADVEDNGNPGKNHDTFQIKYGSYTDGSTVMTIRSGNIEIHQ